MRMRMTRRVANPLIVRSELTRLPFNSNVIAIADFFRPHNAPSGSSGYTRNVRKGPYTAAYQGFRALFGESMLSNLRGLHC
jgi:hypothetical protein